jgi:hypothetical protein
MQLIPTLWSLQINLSKKLLSSKQTYVAQKNLFQGAIALSWKKLQPYYSLQQKSVLLKIDL